MRNRRHTSNPSMPGSPTSETDHVGIDVARKCERSGAVVGCVHLEAFAPQVAAHDFGQGDLVIND